MKNGFFSFLIFICLIKFAGASDSLSIPSIFPSEITAYDIEQGLPMTCVENVFLDPKGRLWLNSCTNQELQQTLGFYQFDGHKSYLPQFIDSSKIIDQSSLFINGITKEGIIYGCRSDLSSVFLLEPNKGKIQYFNLGDNEKVNNIVEGENEEWYLLSSTSTAYFIYKIKKEKIYLIRKIKMKNESNFDVRFPVPFIKVGQDLWFFNKDEGFIHFDLKDSTFKSINWDSILNESSTKTQRHIYMPQMVSDDRGNLFFYHSKLNEVFIFNIKSETLSPYLPLRDHFGQPENHSLYSVVFYKDQSRNIIFDYCLIRDGDNFYKPTKDHSYVLIDSSGQLFDYKPILMEANKASRYKNCELRKIFGKDFKNQVYIALTGGLIVADIKSPHSIKTFLETSPTRSIAELSPNKFLVNADRPDELFLVDTKQNITTNLFEKKLCFEVDLFTTPTQIISDNKGHVWFSERNHLLDYHLESNTCSTYNIGFHFNKFCFLSERQIAFVSDRGQLYYYDLIEKKLVPFLENNIPLIIQKEVNDMYFDRSGTLWIASLGGLWKIDVTKGKSDQLGIKEGFMDPRMMCIHETIEGIFWIGTFSNGVNIYNPKTGDIKVINESNGLSNNTVVGILDDDQGDIWLATYNGINILSKEGNILSKLFEEEGLSNMECNRYSYLKTSDGRLIFGTIEGINVVDPKKLKKDLQDNESPTIYLTGISYFNQKTKKDSQIIYNFEQLGTITLPASKRYIKLSFALSEYSHSDENAFFYKIEKNSHSDEKSNINEWNKFGSIPKLTLNDLPVGRYNILIQGINHKGQWAKTPIIVSVQVREFFYKTYWFYLICAIPFVVFTLIWMHRLSTEKHRLVLEIKKATDKINKDKNLIEAQAEKLQELDQAKSRFFTNISHEFRTPLTIISGMIDQIKTKPDLWLEKGTQMIKENTRSLLNLVNQILELRKLESGSIDINMIQGDVIQYLRYIAESHQSIAEGKGIQLHFLAAKPSINMDYDPDKLLWITSNLLSNAVKYTPESGNIYFHINSKNENGEDYLQMRVEDTGAGIPEDQIQNIFNRFYQVDDSTTRTGEGTGIGLAFTKELIKLLTGEINVSSEVGKGTTFFVSLPITNNSSIQDALFQTQKTATKSIENSSEKAALNADDLVSPNTELPKLLIVEDNADVVQFLIACLEGYYQLEIARDGQEGIDKAIEQVPDIIVSDVMMPEKNGFELCNTLKQDQRTSHIPIILLTAKADLESKISGLERGADAYLTKPFEPKELLARLKNLLVLRKKLQDRYRSFQSTDIPANAEDAFILKVRKVIDENIEDEDFGIIHLCKAIKLSRSQLHNKIKALTDLSTSIFIRKIRLEKGKSLLESTDLNVSEIAYRVGFKNSTYFTQSFTEEFGFSPRKTRK
jgi:signal transduction histidine kinase/DNA-binding response OmpR family regulator